VLWVICRCDGVCAGFYWFARPAKRPHPQIADATCSAKTLDVRSLRSNCLGYFLALRRISSAHVCCGAADNQGSRSVTCKTPPARRGGFRIWADNMKDVRERLNKLRADAADLALISRRANDPQKRELFGRLADELAIEALELEQVVKRQSWHSGSSDLDNVAAPQTRAGRH
jgi:hypothetical protein